MTVAELIEQLSTIDSSREVYLFGDEFDVYGKPQGAWEVTLCRNPEPDAITCNCLVSRENYDLSVRMSQENDPAYEPPDPEPRRVAIVGSIVSIPREDRERLFGR